MTTPKLPAVLKNRYIAFRHGHSEANKLGIISSDMSYAVSTHGLTKLGREQVQASAEKLRPMLRDKRIIITSPFLRAVQTAEIVQYVLGVGILTIDPRLRERFFGSLDGQSNTGYDLIWEHDRHSAEHEEYGAESPAQVGERMTGLFCSYEDHFAETDIIMPSHGDTLQMAQAVITRTPITRHRSLPHLETGEARPLN